MNRLPRRAQPMVFQVQEQKPSYLSRLVNAIAWIIVGPFFVIAILGRVMDYLLYVLTNTIALVIFFIAVPFLFGFLIWVIFQVVISGFAFAISGIVPAVVFLVFLVIFTFSLGAVIFGDTNKSHLRGSEFSEQKPPTFPTNTSTSFPTTPTKPPSGSQSMPTRPVRRRF